MCSYVIDRLEIMIFHTQEFDTCTQTLEAFGNEIDNEVAGVELSYMQEGGDGHNVYEIDNIHDGHDSVDDPHDNYDDLDDPHGDYDDLDEAHDGHDGLDDPHDDYDGLDEAHNSHKNLDDPHDDYDNLDEAHDGHDDLDEGDDGHNTSQVALQENGACGQNSIPYSIKICGSLILWIFNCWQKICNMPHN